MQQPKFKVGDIAALAVTHPPNEKEINPVKGQKLFISEILIQTCDGGTQIWYSVRPYAMERWTRTISFIKDYFKMREDELRAWTDDDERVFIGKES